MAPKTKRVDKLHRKKGCYISQESAITNEIINLEEENLREFEETEKKLINEVLHWHKGSASNIRTVYTETSRTTTWRQEIRRKELENDAKGMKALDTFFINKQFTDPSTENNLQMCLKEINQQCLVSKSVKTNNNVFTYNYLCCLCIYNYYWMDEVKMDTSNQIAQTMWNKGKHTKLESLLNGENFKESCQSWKPESRFHGNLKIYTEGILFQN
ncbi:9613_t:CDS:2 [Diversispora eburnea]|uniref:9613_t:CDS:1 n=1 Tax=Diversispora eburnea TaxID=1213867 RepID=A0A9N8W8W0_9GLOM|nr:9613_t:CDS:2 [Diversispora eburnea]